MGELVGVVGGRGGCMIKQVGASRIITARKPERDRATQLEPKLGFALKIGIVIRIKYAALSMSKIQGCPSKI
jgi:hypothetical protein